MPFWRRKKAGTTPAGLSLDEFVGDGAGRDATPLDLARDPSKWQSKLAALTDHKPERRELALTAFTLIRGGDMFERAKGRSPPRTSDGLIEAFEARQLRLHENKLDGEVQDLAMQGILRVVRGNPAICMRMMLAKPIDVVLIPKDDDFRRYGFPRNTNPRAAGIFYNSESADRALIGLRQEHVLSRPWLMVHEMTHAVHLMGLTAKEREHIDEALMPVYRSRRWVEEAVAIYAEMAFGAQYGEADLQAPGLYGKTRREWTDRAVFALFMSELLRP